MGLFNSIVDSFESTGGQIGAVVGGLVGGVPGAVAGAVLGNEVDYWTNQAGDALVQAQDWVFETANGARENLADDAIKGIEYGGFDGGDITNWVDASTYSDYAYELPGGVGKFDSSDLYSFTINYASNFYATLNDLTTDVDIYLLDDYGNTIDYSLELGTAADSVNAILNPGTYHLDVVTGDYQPGGIYYLEVGSTLTGTAINF